MFHKDSDIVEPRHFEEVTVTCGCRDFCAEGPEGARSGVLMTYMTHFLSDGRVHVNFIIDPGPESWHPQFVVACPSEQVAREFMAFVDGHKLRFLEAGSPEIPMAKV